MTLRPLLLVLTLAVASAGCISGTNDGIDAAGDLDAAPFMESVVQGSIQASAATPLRTVNYGGEYSHAITVSDETTGIVLELSWSAANPATEKLSIWVRPSGEGTISADDPITGLQAGAPLAKVSGVGPLRLVLPVDVFPETGDYDVVVRAADEPAGVAAEQTFTLHVTSFTGAFDAEHSQLE